MENFLNLRRFFDEFRNLGFWQRLFSWKGVRALSYAAYEDLARLGEQLKNLQNEAESFRHQRELLLQERDSFQMQLAGAKESFVKLDLKMQHLDQEVKKI
jgi:uncharacterized protein (DUF3084 family)